MKRQISFWQDSEYHSRPPLRKTVHADVAVIGGGIAGIFATYHLAKKGFKTVLIEKEMLASYAGGRNEGMIVEGLAMDFVQIIDSLGNARAKEAWLSTVKAREIVANLARKLKIGCNLEKTGSLYVALTKEQEKWLKKEAAARKRAGLHCKMLSKEQVPLPGPFEAALYAPNDYLVHPVKLLRGIAKAAEKLGAQIYEHTPALTFGPRVVRTPKGRIVADKVFLALEYFSPFAKRQTEHKTRGHVIVTKPLSAKKIRSLGWRYGHMMWECMQPYHAIRLVGNRFMIGGNVPKKPTKRDFARQKAEMIQTLLNYFPMLDKKDVAVAYEWNCVTIHTKRRLPSIGRINGCYQAFGYAGNGLTQASYAGKIIADHFDGKPIPEIYNAKKKGIKFDITW